MRKGVFFTIAILFSILILSPLITAQPPFIQEGVFTEGYEIKIPPFGVLKQGSDFEFSFHVYNISDGIPVGNSTTICQLHLYNSTGNHLFIDTNIPHSDDVGIPNDWDVIIDGNNFSLVGDYAYLIQCNSSFLGGFDSVEFQVTSTGRLLKTSDSINYSILTLGALFLFLLCLYGGMVLPFKNERDEEQKIVSVEKLKYFKVGLIFLSYVFFVWFLNLLLTLSTNFSVLTQFTKFFEVIFSVTNTVSLALFVLMLFLMSVLAWKDLQLKKLLDKGISPD